MRYYYVMTIGERVVADAVDIVDLTVVPIRDVPDDAAHHRLGLDLHRVEVGLERLEPITAHQIEETAFGRGATKLMKELGLVEVGRTGIVGMIRGATAA